MSKVNSATRGTRPRHLSAKALKHWDRVVGEYTMTPDSLMILQTALENWDQGQEARAILRKEGLVMSGKRHPCVEIAKAADSLFMRGMRELGLNISDPGDVGRPPDTLGSAAAGMDVEQERLF